MPDHNTNDSSDHRSHAFRALPFGWIVAVVAVGVFSLTMALWSRGKSREEAITPQRLTELAATRQIVSGEIRYDARSGVKEITGRYRSAENPADVVAFRSQGRFTGDTLEKLIATGSFKSIAPNTALLQLLNIAAPIFSVAAVIGLIAIFLFRRLDGDRIG